MLSYTNNTHNYNMLFFKYVFTLEKTFLIITMLF